MYQIARVVGAAAALLMVQPAQADDTLLKKLAEADSCNALMPYVGKQVELGNVRIQSATLGGLEDTFLIAPGYLKTDNVQAVVKARERAAFDSRKDNRMFFVSRVVDELVSRYQSKIVDPIWKEYSDKKSQTQLLDALREKYEKYGYAKFGAKETIDKYKLPKPDILLLEFHSVAGDEFYNKAVAEISADKAIKDKSARLAEIAANYLRSNAELEFYRDIFVNQKKAEVLANLRKQGDPMAVLVQSMDSAIKEEKDLRTILKQHPVYTILLDAYPADRLGYFFDQLDETIKVDSDLIKSARTRGDFVIPLIFSSPQTVKGLKHLWDNAGSEGYFDIKGVLACNSTEAIKKQMSERSGDGPPRIKMSDLEFSIARELTEKGGDDFPITLYIKVDEMRERK